MVHQICRKLIVTCHGVGYQERDVPAYVRADVTADEVRNYFDASRVEIRERERFLEGGLSYRLVRDEGLVFERVVDVSVMPLEWL